MADDGLASSQCFQRIMQTKHPLVPEAFLQPGTTSLNSNTRLVVLLYYIGQNGREGEKEAVDDVRGCRPSTKKSTSQKALARWEPGAAG